MAYKDKKEMQKYNNDFSKEHYDRLNVLVPKGRKEEIKAYAKMKGLSLSAFVNLAIDEAMQGGDVLEFSDNDSEDIQ